MKAAMKISLVDISVDFVIYSQDTFVDSKKS